MEDKEIILNINIKNEKSVGAEMQFLKKTWNFIGP